jgi:hypothetical protein
MAMMETASTSETSVNFYQTPRVNNLEGGHLRICRREEVKSQMDCPWYVISVAFALKPLHTGWAISRLTKMHLNLPSSVRRPMADSV